jgi:hypothetical protein
VDVCRLLATPEASDFTAIQQRLQTSAAQRASSESRKPPPQAQKVVPSLHSFKCVDMAIELTIFLSFFYY